MEKKAKKAKYQHLSDDTKKLIYAHLSRSDVQDIVGISKFSPNSALTTTTTTAIPVSNEEIHQRNLQKNLAYYGSKKMYVNVDDIPNGGTVSQWLMADEVHLVGKERIVSASVQFMYRLVDDLVETVRKYRTRELVLQNLIFYLVPVYLSTFSPEHGNSYQRRKVIVYNMDLTLLTMRLKPPHPWEFEFHVSSWLSFGMSAHLQLFSGYERLFLSVENLESFFQLVVENQDKLNKWKNHSIELTISNSETARQAIEFYDYLIQQGIPFSFYNVIIDVYDLSGWEDVDHLIRFLSIPQATRQIQLKFPHKTNLVHIPSEFYALLGTWYSATNTPIVVSVHPYNLNIIKMHMSKILAVVPVVVEYEQHTTDSQDLSLFGQNLLLAMQNLAQNPNFQKAILKFNANKCEFLCKPTKNCGKCPWYTEEFTIDGECPNAEKTDIEKCHRLFLDTMKNALSQNFTITRDPNNHTQYNVKRK